MRGHLTISIMVTIGDKLKEVTIQKKWIDLPDNVGVRDLTIDKIANELRSKNELLPELCITFTPTPEHFFR